MVELAALAARVELTPDGHPTLNQVGRKVWQSIELTFCPAGFDRNVQVLDVTGFFETLAERGQQFREHGGRSSAEDPNHRHRRLLRPRRERPRSPRPRAA
jgi:hypothetical protein